MSDPACYFATFFSKWSLSNVFDEEKKDLVFRNGIGVAVLLSLAKGLHIQSV
jgi:hypothetical protein